MAVLVRPASQDRGEGAEERRWRAARPVLTAGLNPAREGLDPGRAGGHLPLGRLPLGPLVCAEGLPSAVNALRDLGDDGLRR